jgi:glycosyltransferase involved in cell wall biosynthesis
MLSNEQGQQLENENVRVLHVTNAGGFGRLQRGGGERAVEELSAQFASTSGWAAAVCAPRDFLESANISDSVQRFPVDLQELTIANALRSRSRLNSVIRDYAPTVVITHLLRGSVVGVLAARFHSNARVISNLHNSLRDSAEHSGGSKARSISNMGLFRSVGRLADAHVAISASNAYDLIRYDRMPKSRVHLINNWVSEEFTGLVRPPRRSTREFRLILVGRLESQKRPHFAVEILAGLPEWVTLDLIGEGSLRGAVERRSVELGLGHRVRFLGQRGDIAALTAEADLLLVPSRFEGFGRVAVEAMSVGTRVICSDAAGLRDVTRGAPDHLVAVIPVEPEAWRSQIEQFMTVVPSDDDVAALRIFAAENYSLRASADAYRDLVRAVLADPTERLARPHRDLPHRR